MSFRYRFADGDHVSRHVDGLARANELADPHCWSWNAGDIRVPGRCLGRAIATRKAEQTLIQRKSDEKYHHEVLASWVVDGTSYGVYG